MDSMQRMMSVVMGDAMENMYALRSLQLDSLLVNSGVHPMIVSYLTGAVNRIYDIVSSSGVQILIFLAGLQSISPSLYEASKIEGATGYEAFWKITVPLISPLMLTNVIYTIIDSFMNNEMTEMMHNTAFSDLQFGYSAVMSWIYFLVISLVLLVTAVTISRAVFYNR